MLKNTKHTRNLFMCIPKLNGSIKTEKKLITNSETICVIVLVSLSRIIFDTKEENKIPLKEGTLKNLIINNIW